MPARPQERILQDLVQGRGTGAKFQRKLAAGKESNWLLAITLNAFAKLDAGAKPTDLEQIVIKAFRDHGFSDREMKSHGRLFRQMPETTKRALFPGTFASLTLQSDYSVNDLKADLPSLQRNILGQANALNIDVDAIHSGRAHRRDFAVPSLDVVKEHGGGLMRAVETNLRPRDNPPTGGTPPPDTGTPPDTNQPPRGRLSRATPSRRSRSTVTMRPVPTGLARMSRTGSSDHSRKGPPIPHAAKSSAMSTAATTARSTPVTAVSGGRTARPRSCRMGRSAR